MSDPEQPRNASASSPGDDAEKPTIGLSGAVAIDAVCDEFEAAWKAGRDEPPELVEYYRRGVEDGVDAELLALELLLIDRAYRRRIGNELSRAVYQELLPGLEGTIDQAFAPESQSMRTAAPAEMNTLAGDAMSTGVGDRVRYFGDYELLEEIARGGMGVVYRAKQLSLNRVIALKMILSGTLADAESVRRFQLEAESAANLDHPGIVPIYDIGQHNGQHYFSMKLIEGRTLSQVSEQLRESPRSAAEMVAKIAEAVHHAHQRGILHRDLKPGNVLIDGDGQPVVTDFGLARKAEANQQLTQTGAVVGTPGFMSPEQASGAGVTTATDVYSLGAILYDLLCGQPPHAKSAVIDTLMAVVNEEPQRPRALNAEIPSDLELICLKALAKEPAERYTSAGAFADDLRAHLVGEPIAVRAPSLIELARMWVSKNYGNVVWLPFIALVMGGLSGFSLWVATMGQDQSRRIPYLEHFGDAVAKWQLVDWHPFRMPAIALFFILLATMGWVTATLVKTKNRAADFGAGLSVGLLSGLIAFIAGMGAMFVAGGMKSLEYDEWILQLAAAGNVEQAEELIANSYGSIKDLPQSQRADLLLRKIESTRAAEIVKWNVIGTAVCLLLFGYIGTTQTLVAGTLRREASLFKAIVGYSCFSLGLVAIGLIVGTELSMVAQHGSGSIIRWKLPVLCLSGIVVGCWLVWRRYAWTWQVATAIIWLTLFIPLLNRMFFTLPAPVVARLRSEIRLVERAVKNQPNDAVHKIRLAEAQVRFADALMGANWSADAFDHYKVAAETLTQLSATDQLDNNAKNMHANVLFAQARAATEMGNISEAARIYTQLTSTYYASRQAMDGYADTVWRSGQPPVDLIQVPKAGTPWDWYRTARQLRWLERYRRENLADSSGRPEPSLAVLVEQVVERAAGQTDVPALRRQRLKQWLMSQQRWELFGPYPLRPGTDTEVADEMEALDEPYGPEQTLVSGAAAPIADEVLALPTGLPVELTDLLANRPGLVGYGRTKFHLAEPQTLTFRLGSNDGVKMWIDGKVVHRNDEFRDHVEASDLVTVDLTAGEHELVLKITQGTATWGFLLDAADVEGWPLPLWGTDDGE